MGVTLVEESTAQETAQAPEEKSVAEETASKPEEESIAQATPADAANEIIPAASEDAVKEEVCETDDPLAMLGGMGGEEVYKVTLVEESTSQEHKGDEERMPEEVVQTRTEESTTQEAAPDQEQGAKSAGDSELEVAKDE